MTRMSRRRLLGTMASGALLAARGRAAPPKSSGLVVRLDRPAQLETPVAALDDPFTPNNLFFVRSHFDPPAQGLFAPRLVIRGEAPLVVTQKDLEKMEAVELPAVLQCSGNGRALHVQRVPGIQWEKGAVGQAKWRGVRLAELLDRAGRPGGAAHVHLRGLDTPPHPGTPPFVRSLPLDRALAEHTLVAYAMNGQPLPHVHGGPFRLVVPGWAGNHWMKWLCEVSLSAEPAKGFFMDTGYQMPVRPGSAEYAPLGALPVKSWITRPLDGATLGRRPVEIRGHAFTGEGHVTQVEVSTDGGSNWAIAKLDPLPSPGAWQRFTYTWKPDLAGRHLIVARATDSRGGVQPEVSPGNRSGYCWNGWDRVTVAVES